MLYQAASSTLPQGGLTCYCCSQADQSRFHLALGEQQKVSQFVNILKYACSATALQSLEITSETIIMDHHFFHFCSVHGLVAKFQAWDLELVTNVACLFCSCRTHPVLCQLVMHQPAFILLLFDTSQ